MKHRFCSDQLCNALKKDDLPEFDDPEWHESKYPSGRPFFRAFRLLSAKL
jgi:hypothetical protein